MNIRVRTRTAELDKGLMKGHKVGLPFVVEADMFLGKSDAAASLPIYGQRKRDLRDYFESNIEEINRWRKINAAYHEDDYKFMRFLVPPGKRVLELGCGRGDLLATLMPSYGVGIDFGAATIAKAKERYPHLTFVLGDVEDSQTLERLEGPFDYIVIADTIAMFEDIDGTLRLIHKVCAPSTRIIISYYSHLWEPVLKTAEALGLRNKQPKVNYVATADFLNLMDLADFEVLSREPRQLLPRHWLGLGPLSIALSRLCRESDISACGPIWSVAPYGNSPIGNIPSASSFPAETSAETSKTPSCECPNSGCARRFLFVEGNSSDGTYEECLRVRDAYREQWDIKVLKQEGKGKGDAVRKGFAAATGDVLMILDADLTMPPEALPKYHSIIETGKGEFVNGTRLIYPMEDEAMRPLNFIANRLFAYLFSYLVNTRLTDTLCGTKVLLRKDYQVLANERGYFGNFDPFGDFDLIFGAAKQNLKIIETPIHYKARTFGETQISRFRDGWLLLKMVWFAYRKLKAI